MFAENPHAEYVFRDDGTRVYSHNPDANRYRKLNDVGKCVQVCTASASCRAPLHEYIKEYCHSEEIANELSGYPVIKASPPPAPPGATQQ